MQLNLDNALDTATRLETVAALLREADYFEHISSGHPRVQQDIDYAERLLRGEGVVSKAGRDIYRFEFDDGEPYCFVRASYREFLNQG